MTVELLGRRQATAPALHRAATARATGAPPALLRALDEFTATVADERYPCMYATRALRRDSLLCAHLTWRNSPAHHRRLADLVSAYLSALRDMPPQDAAMVALVVFLTVPPGSAGPSTVAAWQAIQALMDLGGGVDGDAIPLDDPAWALTFEATRLFVNISSPGNRRRRSRNLGSRLALVIQPRDGIDLIAPLNERGDRIREAVRQRIDAYDEVPRSPDLSRNGATANHDWKQYELVDDERGWQGPCPLGNPTRVVLHAT